MDSFHYTMVDPQMVPADLLDLAQPQDIFGYSYTSFTSEEGSEEEQESDDEEAGGIIATVSRLFASPFSLIFYFFEMILEDKIKK